MAWKRWMVALSAAVLLLGVAGTGVARAGGVGFAVEVGSGDGEQEWENSGDIDSSASRVGIGFVYDTNVLGRNAFNYRMNLFLEKQTFEEDGTDFETDLRGIAMENDFGFGGNIAPNVRLWGGPSLRLGIYGGEDDLDADYSVVGIGIGPVLGANIAVNDRLALTGRAGLMMSAYSGNADDPVLGDLDYSSTETSFFFNFGLLFQTGR